MNWIIENIQIVIALAAAIAYWLTNLRTSRELPPEPEQEAEDVFGPDFDFGERRDEPAPRREIQLPPPLNPRPHVPPPLPVRTSAAETELARQQAIMDRLNRLRKTQADPAPAIAAPRTSGGRTARTARTARVARVAKVARQAKSSLSAYEIPATSTNALRNRLRDRHEFRRAIVLREVLGPPLGLR